MEEQVLNYVVFRVRGMLELLKGREKAIPDLKLSFLPSLYEWMKASGLFSFADMLRCLIVVLYVLNVGVLYVHFLCTGVAFLCYSNEILIILKIKVLKYLYVNIVRPFLCVHIHIHT